MKLKSIVIYVMTLTKFGETLLSNLASWVGGSKGGSDCQKRISNGDDYSDRIFYLIARPNDWGIGSILTMYIRHFDYALRRGWIPVVDMQNVHNLYLDDENLGKPKSNAWDLFFEQPGGYVLDKISSAKNIVVAPRHLLVKNNFEVSVETMLSDEKIRYWQNVAQKTIRFSRETMYFINEMRTRIFSGIPENEKVLGVYCRGTDYLEAKPKNHPVQPSPEMSIKKAKEVMSERGIRYIYLVTEDERILDQFKSEFTETNQLLYIPAQRYGSTEKEVTYIWQREDMLGRERYLNGVEYLAGLQMLAECDAFIGGVTGGTAAAMLLRNNLFEYQYFWSLGRY